MFESARLKLTAWYLAIIMLISIFFSVTIFYILSHELDNNYHRIALRFESRVTPVTGGDFDNFFGSQAYAESIERIKLNLIYINLIILAVSAVFGYFLSGLTLKPIQQMITEQDRFIADASHEFRTPLTALRASIEVGLRDKKLDLKEARGLLESNLEEVASLQALSDGLLKLAQYQKGRSERNFQEVILSEVAKEAIDKVKSLAKSKDIKINNKVGDQKVEGDKQSLVDLFIIFLDNAIKYSSSGKSINLISKILDHTVQIDITDQGIGIDEKDLPHLFDRFYRSDQARVKAQSGGYGLGLSIAQNIIALHSGHLSVQSKIGEGSTFSIFLPVLSQRMKLAVS